MKVTVQKGRCVHRDGKIYLYGEGLDVSQKEGERLKNKGAVTFVEEEISQDAILEAAKKAIEEGKVTGDGKPKLEAIAAILGQKVSAADRDAAFEKLKGEDDSNKQQKEDHDAGSE